MTERLPNHNETGWDTIIEGWLEAEHNPDGTHKFGGIPTGSKFLRDDRTWADPPTGSTTTTTTPGATEAERLNLVIPPSQLAVEILADTPKLYWKLDDPVGSATVADSSGLAHTGMVGANVHLGGLGLGNRPGAAWVNEAGSNGTITVASHADFNVADVFTLEFCIRLRQDYAGHTTFTPSVFGSTTAAHPHIGIGSPANGRFYLNSQGVSTICTSTTALSDTHAWHHVLVRKSGATVTFRIDNVDVTSAVSNVTFASANMALSALADHTRISMCHCALYNTSLSNARADAHYAAFQADNTYAANPVTFGVHTDSNYFTTGTIDSHLATVQAVNGKMARATVRWEIIQTSDGGAYDWARHDDFVHACNLNNVTPLFVLSGSPTWASGGTNREDVPGVGADATFKSYVEKWQRFVRDFVDRYKPGGSGTYTVPGELWLEFWNEPNLNGFWHNLSANTDQQWADKFAYWYRLTRATALDRYPAAKCILAGLSSWGATGAGNQTGEAFLRKVVGSTQWTGAHIDYQGYHPYSGTESPDDLTDFSNHFNDVLVVRDVVAELGYPYAPVCVTEYGFADTTSQADQASKLTSSISRITGEWASFVPFFVWFVLGDDVAANYGLFTSIPSSGAASTATKSAASNYSNAATPFAGRARYTGAIKQRLNPATATASDIATALIALGLVDHS